MLKLLLETGTVASTLVSFRKGCLSSNQSHVLLFQRGTKHHVRQFSVIRTYPSPSQTRRGPITHFAPGPRPHSLTSPRQPVTVIAITMPLLRGCKRYPGNKNRIRLHMFQNVCGKEAGTRFSEVWHLIFAIEKFLCWKQRYCIVIRYKLEIISFQEENGWRGMGEFDLPLSFL